MESVFLTFSDTIMILFLIIPADCGNNLFILLFYPAKAVSIILWNVTFLSQYPVTIFLSAESKTPPQARVINLTALPGSEISDPRAGLQICLQAKIKLTPGNIR